MSGSRRCALEVDAVTPPRPPADLDAPERALWRRSIEALEAVGVWKPADVDALERYVRASAMSRLARERITARAADDPASAYISRGSQGQPVTHPDVELERRARLDADALARQLGLTPQARRQLLGRDDGADDLERELASIMGGER
jgi:P27 family predicted phage terminase small subunit